MGPGEVQTYCKLDKESLAMMRLAVERMGLSARAYHRVLKLSRTIADLAGSEAVQQGRLVMGRHLDGQDASRCELNSMLLLFVSPYFRHFLLLTLGQLHET
jgi:hypothetical protein